MRCLATLVVSLSLVACSSTTSSSPVDDGGTGELDSGADAARMCTSLVYAGAPLNPVAAAGNAPTATGGAIADGTYHLTSYKVYNTTIDPSKVQSLQGSFKFTAGAYELAFSTSVDGEARESGTVMTSGATLQFAMTCPQTMTQGTRRYSATATTFDLYDVSDATATAPTEVATYTHE